MAKLKIAALCCSYNRIEKTTSFFKSLVQQAIPDGYAIDCFLLDDNSDDGTADYVETNFPGVQVIRGSGSLFWAGGMRTLWSMVLKKSEYDFYLLFNDDVVLFDDAIVRILDAYNKSQYPLNIVAGSVQDFNLSRVTYGGHKLTNKYTGRFKQVIPNENELTACDLGNANIMLVDKGTVDKVGILSDYYIHSCADYDYTLKAIKSGIKVWVAPGFYGYCSNDHGRPWMSGKRSLKDRVRYLYSPKGLEYKQYLHYIRKFFPMHYPMAFLKLWLKTLLPVVYDKFKKVEG